LNKPTASATPGAHALEVLLGHRFTDAALLARALTHRSFSADHNERLEFLGDTVLSTAISTMLYARYADAPEGDLTRVRAHLVREDSLHRVALALDLPMHLRLSEGEARGGGAQRASILADALEAIIGAVYLDAGFGAAHDLVRRLFGELIAGSEVGSWNKDPKTELQELLQSRRLPTPSYRIEHTRGQAHAQTFEVACIVASLGLEASGQGRSRRAAEQAAAQGVLDILRARDNALPAA
jgi:ribonuclease-3